MVSVTDEGTCSEPLYGNRPMKVYPVSDTELSDLRMWAWLSLSIVGIPFLIIATLSFVRRLKRQTQFDEAARP